MIQVVDLRVQSFEIDHLDLSWGFEPTTEDMGLYDLEILRAESPGGPFEVISTLTDQAAFRDVNVNRQHTWRTYYYKIKVTNRRDGGSVEFGPEHLRARPTLEGLEMSRLFALLLRTHVGRRCWVFKRRTSGQRCMCYDKTVGRRTTDRCVVCFDTGFVGGYWAPIETYMQIDPTSRTTQLQVVGETQQQNTGGRIPAFPQLDPRDLVVEVENVRWRVAQSTPTERARSVVHQEIQLHRLSESDIEFDIPVNVTTPTEATPVSLFTEPMSP